LSSQSGHLSELVPYSSKKQFSNLAWLLYW
jgi:hypothetical protein